MEIVIVVSCAFLVIALMKFLYDYLWIPLRIQQVLNSQGINGPPYRFIHGNNKEVSKMRMETMSKAMGLSHDIFPKVQPHLYSWINKYGKNFLYWNGVRPQLVITEAELVKEVMKNNENSFPKRKPTIYGKKLLGNGLVLIQGEKWVKRRKLANHAFHGESLKNMTPAIISSVETMLEKWEGGEGREIEVFREFRLLTSEVISRTAFGSTSEGIRDCVMEIVKSRENRVVNGEVEGFGNDFFGLLLNAYHGLDDRNRLSLEDLVDECKTFYFAGQETVNSLLGWTVFLLAIYGDWQEKARREVIDIFGDQNPRSEGIVKLKTIVSITSHHDPQLWGDDVHLFKPERFAEGIAEATKYNATAFFPFGLGPRSCVGMAFAMTETKIAISMILQRYTITLSPAYVHSPVASLTLQPQHGIQVILHSLHNDGLKYANPKNPSDIHQIK
ncbi:Cytochrome P450 [Hibiscus syriacus]|uniref:Cytochrome P450 n=1 Tax=Hibiscus syriacus TaxID=106335 RepID=A0A6A3BGJ9_HIBSY|nr:Cytochrome P450 [Hibiscus syriacus]